MNLISVLFIFLDISGLLTSLEISCFTKGISPVERINKKEELRPQNEP
jgi:hypothetical protein